MHKIRVQPISHTLGNGVASSESPYPHVWKPEMLGASRNMPPISLRTLMRLLAIITVLFNGSGMVAQGDGMLIRRNVSFAVVTSGLQMEESKDGTQVFITRAVRQIPFLELQFSPPIPQRVARRKVLQIHCDEAGTYAPPGGGSWTIAKRCRTKN